MIGAPRECPEPISAATAAMIDLFATAGRGDVGGWAMPFMLDKEGACFLGYCYSVSDPEFKRWKPGSLIPHGSAEGGGATLSVTELTSGSGYVVYWLQQPGGFVLNRIEDGYDLRAFAGDPATFKKAVNMALDLVPELWIGDTPVGPLRKLLVTRESNGQLQSSIGFHGNGLTFAVHNMATKFHKDSEFLIDEGLLPNLPDGLNVERVSNETIALSLSGQTIELDGKQIEHLMNALALERANIYPQVPEEPKGVSYVAEVDPAWRVDPTLHPGLPGASLNFRHRGFGWQGVVLPDKTAGELGAWLLNFSTRHSKSDSP